jgi:hypothetical protein
MAKYADWYAVELDGYLKGRISEVQRFESTKEILNHFAEHVDDLVSKGMDPGEAEKAAVMAFGSPRQAAINLLGNSKENLLGKWLILVGCTLIAWLTLGMGMTGIFDQLQAYYISPFFQYYYQYQHQAWYLLAISLVAGTVLTRRVPVVKMLAGGGIGISLICIVFIFGPKINFGNVAIADQTTMLAKWNSYLSASVQLAKLENSILEPSYSENYRDEKNLPSDKPVAIERIKSEAPKMLNLNSSLVKVSGIRTSGYLGPAKSDQVPILQNPYEDGMKQGTTIPGSGDTFWVSQMTLQYYESPELALKAWSERQSMYGGTYSLFGSTSTFQKEYIERAKKYFGYSNLQLLLATIGPVILVVLAFLGCMMIVGWPLTKMPIVTLRTSFRRRLA